MEHAFKTIRKVMAGETLPRLILLYGTEAFLLKWAKGFIKETLVNPVTEALDYTYFDEDDINSSDVITACETLPMMSTKKLVVVEADKLFAATKTDVFGSIAEEINAYLPNIPDTTCLVLCCTKPNKVRVLYKSCEKMGLTFDFCALDDATLAGWMEKRVAAAGKTANRADLMAFALGNGYGSKDSEYTLFNLENDLKKVFAFADGSALTAEDFAIAKATEMETDSFKLLDSAFSGNKDNAYKILNNALELSQPSKAVGIVLQFVGLLISQLEIMVEGKERAEEGQSLSRIITDTGVNEYRLKKAMAACSNKTAAELRRSLFDAYDIEKQMKNGILEPRLAMEAFIAGL